MIKILVVITSLICISEGLNGQTTNKGLQAENKTLVCKPVQGKSDVSCYKTNYAENFKVYKNENGYYICSGIPEYLDSSFLNLIGAYNKPNDLYQNQYTLPATKKAAEDKTVAQSQSYSNTATGSH